MHYVQFRNQMTNADDEDLMALARDLFKTNSGIIDSGSYEVVQNSPTGMSVLINDGKAYVYSSTLGYHMRTLLDTFAVTAAKAVLTIDANSSGSTRYDLICIKIDTAAISDANASNIASLVVVKGTPGAGVPATPANYYKLAEITVADGETTITTTEITDRRVQLGMLDEDDMASDSAQALASQQSIKAYVDAQVAAIPTAPVDGWQAATGTWQYASASTITVPSGAAALYRVGDKIKITQTTTKYFYITAVADTLLTVNGGTDYTVANAAITNPYYSHYDTPIGFPDWFNYSPSETWTNPPTSRTTYCKFCVVGRKAMMVWSTKGTANGSNSSIAISLSLPVARITQGAIDRQAIIGNGMWSDLSTFTDNFTIYSLATTTVTAEQATATRKPTIVNISCEWEI